MPRLTTGSVFKAADGYGIRWPEDDKRPQRTGFATKTEARKWFAANVAPRLDRGAPSPDITLDGFCELFLARHGATVSARTRATLEERLAPARRVFGDWTLAELEGAADDIARWRAQLPDTSRYRLTLALRQTLGAAVRWRYLASEPGRRRRTQPRAAQRGAAAVHARRGRRARGRAGAGVRPARRVRRRDRAAHERVDRHRAPRRRPHGPRGGRAAPLRRRRADALPEDRAPPCAAHGARRGCARPAAAAARHAAPVPRGQGRAHRPRHLAHARVVPGARRGRASAGAARTSCGTPSRPRRSRPGSRSSSWRA